MILIAYMPFVGRVDATSDAVSPSRILELVLLGAALIAVIGLRSRSGLSVPSGPAGFVAALVSGFSLWALLTSLRGPLLLTGATKAAELAIICVVAFEIAATANPSSRTKPFYVPNVGFVGIAATVAVLILANIATTGTPLPLAWLSSTGRARLMLGNNHPITSALLLSFGIIFALTARMSWLVKIPAIAALGWVLHLCDARGVEAGCVGGSALVMLAKIPPSPYKLLGVIVAACAAVVAAIWIIGTTDIHQLVLQLVGEDAFTLDSRVDLWSFLLARVQENPLFGVGYYSTRIWLLKEFSWAGNAHNSFVEVLFSTGLVGAALFLGFLGCWLHALLTTRDPVLIGATPLVFLEGTLDPIIFTPDIGMFLMLLVLFNGLLAAGQRAPSGAMHSYRQPARRMP